MDVGVGNHVRVGVEALNPRCVIRLHGPMLRTTRKIVISCYKDKQGAMCIRVWYFSQIPTTLGVEKATNPFLRPHSLEIRKALSIDRNATNIDSFALIRQAKDRF